MQMRTGGASGTAYRGDNLTGADFLSDLHPDGFAVAVMAGKAVFMLDDDQVAITAVRIRKNNGTVADGADGRAVRGGEINAVVMPGSLDDWVIAQAEFPGNTGAH